MGRASNRNDISIAIIGDSSGDKWAMCAQGRPADDCIPDDGVLDYESGLYYSQLRHRVIVDGPSGPAIRCPSQVRDGERVVVQALVPRTGTPTCVRIR